MTSARYGSTTAAGAVTDRMAPGLQTLRNRMGSWLQTREGVAASILAVVVFWSLWAAVGVPVIAALFGAGLVIIVVSLAAQLWESRSAPDAAVFFGITTPADPGVELQQDPNAGFWRDNRGFLWSNRIWFAGTGCPPSQLRPDTYLRLRAWSDQDELPVFVARAGQRQWWWWRKAFYWESGDCGPEDVAALLMMLERDDEQGIEWELDARLGEPIPEDVKHFVYERDRGRCVVCGSDELIQYDQVIPWSLGGDNEPQNVRLLCAGCKRRQASGGGTAAAQPLLQP